MAAGQGITKTLVWILLGLLILGLAGFGVTNLSGTLRTIGHVGQADIRVNDYFRGLQNEIRAIEAARGESISFAQARDMGVTQRVLGQLVAQAALDHETIEMGLSVGDENLRDQILAIPEFRGLDGEFDREAYGMVLDRVGMSEAEFEDQIRRETARSFLQAAVLSGVTMPPAYADTLVDYIGERRSVTWAILDRADLEVGVPVPDDADLAAYHDENAAAFTRPEVKRITYAWLTPEMILDTVEVDDQALRDAYAARESEFNQPERRLVERLVYPDQAGAEAAKGRLDAGEASFEDLVADRGLELADTDMGDVSQAELEGAGEAVFAASAGDVVGPVETDLGPALFRVNAILAAQETSFEEAEAELRDELAADRARRVIDAQIDTVEDLLAGGATVEDLAKETDMEAGQIDWHPEVSDGIAAYAAFRAEAGRLTSDDYPEIEQLDDGGIFAMRLDEVVPPALRPLEEVRDAVEAGWTAREVTGLLTEQAAPLAEALRGGTSFEEAGLEVAGAEEITRQAFLAEAPAAFIDTVFGMAEGEVGVIEGAGRVFVLRLDAIAPPDEADPDIDRVSRMIRDEAASGLAQDLYQVLSNDIRTRAGIELDESAINAVHANFQ